MQLDAQACAQALSEGAWLVDVREPHETDHLAFDHPQCVLMPLSQFERRFAELPRDRQLVLACQAGGRSQQAMHYLQHHGYTQVANLVGGIGLWAASGLPLRRGG
jgi:rhodanese-related sulfurtransferase